MIVPCPRFRCGRRGAGGCVIVGCQSAAEIGEDFVDTLLDSVVGVADNDIAGGAERIGAGYVVLDLFLMNRPIDLDY